MTRVLVLLGGTSEEREVSLKSGEGVYQALLRKGFEAEKLDLAENKLSEIERISPDVVFIALHGKNGEDGTVQGYLELLGIPYTGSGVACSAICMNKIISKKMFIYEGLPTPDFVILSKKAFTRDGLVLKSLIEKFGLPLVVKPATQGSSIGTHIVKLESGLQEAVEDAFRLDNEILVEKFIDGDLLTVAVIGNDEPQVLPVIEIISKNDFYDYESKYTPGMCEHIIPARISQDVCEKVKQITAATYKAMGCRGFSRIDIIVDKQGNPFVLEVNTIPGMTDMSLVPDAAKAQGIEYDDLVEMLINLAME